MEKYLLIITLPCILLAGCLNPVRDLYPEDPSKRPVPVYIVSHGWHAGIAIEAVFVREQLPIHPDLPDNRFLMFGWGDARYYSDPDAGFWILFSAALLPTKSALHIAGFDMKPANYFPRSQVIKIWITEQGAANMGRFIQDYIKTDSHGEPVYYASGLYSNSLFLESNRLYFLPRTSNKWTARALRATGYPISPFYAFTSGNVMKQSKKDGEVIQ